MNVPKLQATNDFLQRFATNQLTLTEKIALQGALAIVLQNEAATLELAVRFGTDALVAAKNLVKVLD